MLAKYTITAERFSSIDGKQLSPLNQSEAIKAAKNLYTGNGEVRDSELITDNPPFELSRRVHSSLPAWRINFDDFGSPSLYISATGVFQASCRLKFKFMPPYVPLSLISPLQG